MKNRNSGDSKALPLVKSVLLSYVVTGILLFILAFILYKLELPASKIRIGVIIVYIIANIIGGFYIGRKKGVKKYLWGGASAAVYFLILIAISLIVSQSMNQDITGISTALIAALSGGVVGGMIS